MFISSEKKVIFSDVLFVNHEEMKITNYASPAPRRGDDLGEDLQTRLHARRQVERLPREQLVPAAAGEGAAQAEVEPGLHLGLGQGQALLAHPLALCLAVQDPLNLGYKC